MRKIEAVAKRLQKELAITHGMINEIIMKCMLLQNKMEIEKSNQEISIELLNQFDEANSKFHIEIPRYRRRLLKINKELGEIYGTH